MDDAAAQGGALIPSTSDIVAFASLIYLVFVLLKKVRTDAPRPKPKHT